MRQIHKILVPVDFSEHSSRALEDAIGLAKAWGAELHLVHSYQVQLAPIGFYGVEIPRDFDRQLREGALAKLHALREEADTEGLSVQEHIITGPAADEVARTAEELGVDLIVMGTRGLSGIKHVLLGSVAERTLRIAPCPVWVTR